MNQARWQALWMIHSQRRGWLARLFWPMSVFYGALIALRQALYRSGVKRSRRVGVPVVVIGNVVVGGAGKTPTVIAVVNHLRAAGWRPGVVSRGHGRRTQTLVHVTPDTLPSDSGDEPALIRLRTLAPVCVSADRVAAARALLAANPEVNIIVCDDGLQHLPLHRDVEVIVFDDRQIGNGWLLPAGLLREPWPRSMAPGTACLVLHQRPEGSKPSPLPCAACTPRFDAVRRLADRAVNPSGEQRPLEQLRVPSVRAVAGTARPGVFFDMLRARGIDPSSTLALTDHAGLADYADLWQDHSTPVLCTEKDAVKLFPAWVTHPTSGLPPIWAVPLELQPDPAFFKALDGYLQRRSKGD